MSKHTKGPWRYYEIDPINYDMGFCVDQDNTAPEQVAEVWEEANANLIAAAPDLLEALEGIRGAYSNPDFGTGVAALMTADKAIAKARGEV